MKTIEWIPLDLEHVDAIANQLEEIAAYFELLCQQKSIFTAFPDMLRAIEEQMNYIKETSIARVVELAEFYRANNLDERALSLEMHRYRVGRAVGIDEALLNAAPQPQGAAGGSTPMTETGSLQRVQSTDALSSSPSVARALAGKKSSPVSRPMQRTDSSRYLAKTQRNRPPSPRRVVSASEWKAQLSRSRSRDNVDSTEHSDRPASGGDHGDAAAAGGTRPCPAVGADVDAEVELIVEEIPADETSLDLDREFQAPERETSVDHAVSGSRHPGEGCGTPDGSSLAASAAHERKSPEAIVLDPEERPRQLSPGYHLARAVHDRDEGEEGGLMQLSANIRGHGAEPESLDSRVIPALSVMEALVAGSPSVSKPVLSQPPSSSDLSEAPSSARPSSLSPHSRSRLAVQPTSPPAAPISSGAVLSNSPPQHSAAPPKLSPPLQDVRPKSPVERETETSRIRRERTKRRIRRPVVVKQKPKAPPKSDMRGFVRDSKSARKLRVKPLYDWEKREAPKAASPAPHAPVPTVVSDSPLNQSLSRLLNRKLHVEASPPKRRPTETPPRPHLNRTPSGRRASISAEDEGVGTAPAFGSSPWREETPAKWVAPHNFDLVSSPHRGVSNDRSFVLGKYFTQSPNVK